MKKLFLICIISIAFGSKCATTTLVIQNDTSDSVDVKVQKFNTPSFIIKTINPNNNETFKADDICFSTGVLTSPTGKNEWGYSCTAMFSDYSGASCYSQNYRQYCGNVYLTIGKKRDWQSGPTYPVFATMGMIIDLVKNRSQSNSCLPKINLVKSKYNIEFSRMI